MEEVGNICNLLLNHLDPRDNGMMVLAPYLTAEGIGWEERHVWEDEMKR